MYTQQPTVQPHEPHGLWSDVLACREAVPGDVITTATAEGLKVLMPGKKARFSDFST